MRARKIDLTVHDVEMPRERVNGKTGKIETYTVTETVNPKDWLGVHLCAQAAGHNLTELVAALDTMAKVRAAGDSVLVDEDEWTMMVEVLDKLRGYDLRVGQMAYRIIKAPEVEVEEKE